MAERRHALYTHCWDNCPVLDATAVGLETGVSGAVAADIRPQGRAATVVVGTAGATETRTRVGRPPWRYRRGWRWWRGGWWRGKWRDGCGLYGGVAGVSGGG
eukprot:3512286-Prymnesium_polylepis.2